MTPLAIALAALSACGYAAGARLQHSAVHDTIGDQGLAVRNQLKLVCNTRWLLGLAAFACGALLHATALGLAPLSVVQPVGVLALPITVLLNVRQRGIPVRELNQSAVLAVIASTGGVAAFVTLAAGSAQATPVPLDDELFATQMVAGAVVVLGMLGLMSRSKVRCLAYAAGCAVAYGLVSLLTRGVAQQIGTGDITQVDLRPVVGIVGAMLIGGWLLQHGYASGPPDLVVACLTVVDPLVAVGLGIGLLGEADRVDAGTAMGELLCAVIACAGVFALARYHPETRDRRTQPPVSATGSTDVRRSELGRSS